MRKKILGMLVLVGVLCPVVTVGAQSSASETAESGLASIFSIESLMNYFVAFVVLGVGVAFGWVLRVFVLRAIERSRGDYIREATKILIGRVIFATVSAVSLAVFFGLLGVDIWTVMAALGVGIGFAFKDLFSNFIAGVTILMQEKINIGDLIHVGQKKDEVFGTVMDITGRATVMHAFNGTEIIVPNADLVSKPVVCYNSNPFRRIEVAIGISFRSDVDKALELAMAEMKKIDGIEPQPKASAIVAGLKDSAVELKLRFWVRSRSGWLGVRTEVVKNVKRAFDENGVVIPFPIRTLDIPKNDRESVEILHELNRQKFEEK